MTVTAVAVICPTREEFDAAGPGAIFLWLYADKKAQGGTGGHVMVKCPGCGRDGGMHMRDPGVEHPPDRESWEISGLPDKVSFYPSVDCQGCCGCHGWLKEGKWEL